MIEQFLAFIVRETATMIGVWQSLDFPSGWAISNGTYRWLLDVAIWKRNVHKQVPDWIDFLRWFLGETRGNSQVFDPKDGRSYQTLTLSDLAKLTRICTMHDLNFDRIIKPKAIKKEAHIQAGFDNSHLVSRKEEPDGPTIPEPASINRSRGARPMDDFDPLGLI